MNYYQTTSNPIPGTRWADVSKRVQQEYSYFRRKTKRRPYIRSAYFAKQKVFLELFWIHLHEKKNLQDKTRRLKFFPCAIELISYSRVQPASKENPNRSSEILHRFSGKVPSGMTFIVQIKEDKRSGKKWLMSVFPSK